MFNTIIDQRVTCRNPPYEPVIDCGELGIIAARRPRDELRIEGGTGEVVDEMNRILVVISDARACDSNCRRLGSQRHLLAVGKIVENNTAITLGCLLIPGCLGPVEVGRADSRCERALFAGAEILRHDNGILQCVRSNLSNRLTP